MGRKLKFGLADPENYQKSKNICCGVAIAFALILLIVAIVITTKCKSLDTFANCVKHDAETMANVIKGGHKYVSLKPTENILHKLSDLSKANKTALIAVTADWCGYCKKLKSSGELTNVAKKYNVIVVDDTHPQVREVMDMMEGEGFPSLGVLVNGKVYPYKGSRENIADTIDKMVKK